MAALVALWSVSAFSQQINWFAGADIVGASGDTKSNLESDFYVREFEISAFSIIDQTWTGVLTLSYHNELEAGESHIEVHEGYLMSSTLLPLTTVRLGQMFLGFGRINRFHRHDWVFTDAPMVQKVFFGNEGAKDTGVEFTRNLVSLNSRLTVGVTSGNSFNHNEEHNHEHGKEETETEAHKKANAPTFYTRLAHYQALSTQDGFETGLNFINRRDKEKHGYQYVGLDFTFKKRTGNFLEHLLQLEAWSRKTEHGDETHHDSGAYLYYQKAFDQHHAIGLRADMFQSGEREHDEIINSDGLELDTTYNAISSSYIYSNSEFMKTRVTLEHGNGIHVHGSSRDFYTRGFVQFVFNIGAHPAHDF